MTYECHKKFLKKFPNKSLINCDRKINAIKSLSVRFEKVDLNKRQKLATFTDIYTNINAKHIVCICMVYKYFDCKVG